MTTLPELSLPDEIFENNSFTSGIVSQPKGTVIDQILQTATGAANTVHTIVNTIQNIIPKATTIIPKATTIIPGTVTSEPSFETQPPILYQLPQTTQSQVPSVSINSITPTKDNKDNTLLYVGGIALLLLGAYALKKKKYIKAKV